MNKEEIEYRKRRYLAEKGKEDYEYFTYYHPGKVLTDEEKALRLKENKKKFKELVSKGKQCVKDYKAKLKEAKPVKAKKKPENNTKKPIRNRKPVMCLETQEVFESTTDAHDWHYKMTGYKSDIYTACIRGNATRGGYHFTFVAK